MPNMTTKTAFDATKFRLFTLTKGRKSIRLYSMIHIAPAEFFEARQAAWERDYRRGWVIQIEGMRGMPFDLKEVYAEVAEVLGCVVQPRPRVPFEVHDLTYQDFTFKDRFKMRSLHAVLKTFARIIKLADPEQMQETFFSKSHEPTDQIEGKLRFLLDRRNQRAVDGALGTPRNVSMVWGVAHVPGIISLLQEQGYTLAK